jgi:hypothetical protein
MKNTVRIGFSLAILLAVVAVASASPVIDGAVVKPRIWNDASYSTFTSTNLYPATVMMNDAGLDGSGWANRHNFRLSANGGISEAVFLNGDSFSLAADVTITGTANIEGGLNVSPWWSQDVDGVFMLNTESGEVACWGGRLPFYSFTVNNGVTYTKGQTVRLAVTYDANSLTALDPGTIQYSYTIGATTYLSPVLPFDMGNPAEDPPYGLWGILNNARVGGFFMPKVNSAIPGNWGHIEFQNIAYTPEPASLVLGLLALVSLRRR